MGAYREEEVSSTHPLSIVLQEIEEEGIKSELLYLKNLTKLQTKELIEASLEDSCEKSSELNEIVFRKTLGNPFYIKQLLQLMYDEKKLYFNQLEEQIGRAHV